MSDAAVARLRLAGQAETEALGRLCAEIALPGDCFLLSGGLGAGKSTFARAFIRHLLGAEEEVPSPTFTLVQQYGPFERHGRETEIWHADLYRLGDPDEVLELGLEEAFGTALCLVEWPDRLGSFAPEGAIELAFEIPQGDGQEGDDRTVEVRLSDSHRHVFEAACGAADLEVVWKR